ncbi:MAG: sigma-70 family RNA polymerase sigma factor [Kofleriaceae bacterium]|nr:MAG: sigma-70 family RNA polymerase sigma factor [Kofleriaceae bacterium]MBZ0233364.1 sigma-70 family RNA polymerase sigma factor [Kofleriaceae bacterium]
MLSRRDSRKEFEATALPHLDALYGTAYRLARNPRDAEDLVQEALLRAYRFWETFEKDSNCKAWLLRILTNTFINEYQRKRRQREVLDAATAEQSATDGVLVHEGAQAQKSPEGMMLERSVSDDVQRALDALPADFRTAVVLCDVEGLAYKEIAEVMDCPVGTVMSRLFRGRRLLQQSLAQFAVEQGYVKADAADEPISMAEYRNKAKTRS